MVNEPPVRETRGYNEEDIRKVKGGNYPFEIIGRAVFYIAGSSMMSAGITTRDLENIIGGIGLIYFGKTVLGSRNENYDRELIEEQTEILRRIEKKISNT